MKMKKTSGKEQIKWEMLQSKGQNRLKVIKVPDRWENAEVILLFKKGNIDNLYNYRPITLLTNLNNILAKIKQKTFKIK